MAQVKEQQTVEEVEKEKNEAREKLAQEMAAQRAEFIWEKASDEGSSPYLERKMVKAHGVRLHKSNLLDFNDYATLYRTR